MRVMHFASATRGCAVLAMFLAVGVAPLAAAQEHGLRGGDKAVERITKNILDKLVK